MSISTVVLAAAAGAALLAAAALVIFAMSRHKKAAAGPVVLLGAIASVDTALEPEGSVLVGGELWRARSVTGESVGRGARVRVVAVNLPLLEVEPVS